MLVHGGKKALSKKYAFRPASTTTTLGNTGGRFKIIPEILCGDNDDDDDKIL